MSVLSLLWSWCKLQSNRWLFNYCSTVYLWRKTHWWDYW